jgi:hypothetical protein
MMWQDLDPAWSSSTSPTRIYHVDCMDVKVALGNGRNGRLGLHSSD